MRGQPLRQNLARVLAQHSGETCPERSHEFSDALQVPTSRPHVSRAQRVQLEGGQRLKLPPRGINEPRDLLRLSGRGQSKIYSLDFLAGGPSSHPPDPKNRLQEAAFGPSELSSAQDARHQPPPSQPPCIADQSDARLQRTRRWPSELPSAQDSRHQRQGRHPVGPSRDPNPPHAYASRQALAPRAVCKLPRARAAEPASGERLSTRAPRICPRSWRGTLRASRRSERCAARTRTSLPPSKLCPTTASILCISRRRMKAAMTERVAISTVPLTQSHSCATYTHLQPFRGAIT